MMSEVKGRLWAPAAFLAFAAVSLAALFRMPLGIPFWRGAIFSDVLVSHWPNANLLRHSLIQWDQIPLWNPMILSGAPFAADPLAGLWYPPNWLVLALPIPLAFNILLWLHLGWTGWGMYRWMRQEAAGQAAAWIAAFAWAGAAKWMAHVGLGHLTLVFAASWTPWALSLVRETVIGCQESTRAGVRSAALGGMVLGLVFLADPRWSLPLVLFVSAYGLRSFAHRHTEESPGIKEENRRRRYVTAVLVMGGCAAGLTSGLSIPLMEFVQLSTRANLSGTESAVLSLPAARLLGFLTPFLDQPEWMAYPGVIVLLLALIGMFIEKRKTSFWILVVLGSVIFALGDQTPLYRLIVTIIPGADLLRVPPRALFLASFSLAVLAGFGLEMVIKDELPAMRRRRLNLGFIAFTALIVMFNVSFWVYTGKESILPLGIALIASLGAVWFVSCRQRRVSHAVVAAGWLFLVGLDVFWVNLQLIEVRDGEQSLQERIDVVESLGVEDYTRSFSPSYSIPQQTAAWAGLQLAEGVNPLQLASYRDYMAQATGFDPGAYSVTLPPFPDGIPSQPWDIRIDASKLAVLNIRYVISEYPLEADHFFLAHLVGSVLIYENEMPSARAWVQQNEAGRGWHPVEIEHWSPNRITMEVAGPGMLVLSEIEYPGWIVSVDGHPEQVIRIDGLLRGVDLDQGEHHVVFEFRPVSVYLGTICTLMTMFLTLWIWVRR